MKFNVSTENINYAEATSTVTGSSYRDVDVGTTNQNYTIHTQSTYIPLRQNVDIVNTTTPIGYRIYYTYSGTNYYLTFDPTLPNGLKPGVTEESEATVWVANTYYSPSGYSDYYLNYGNNTARCTQSTENRFTLYNNNRLRVYSGGYKYLYYSGSGWGATGTTSYITRVTAYSTKQIPTGIPLDTNTGYIVGGASNDNNASKLQGNIRISQYFGPAAQEPSLGGISLSNGSVSIDTIYTIKNGGVALTTASDWATDSPFSKTKEKMEEVLSNDTNYIYGLHFIDSQMLYGLDGSGNDQSVYAESATINGNSYDNYELPQNCIDFNLKEKGFINFIAGTYFSGNNCFFTISEIQRNENTQKITKIKNIYRKKTQPIFLIIPWIRIRQRNY